MSTGIKFSEIRRMTSEAKSAALAGIAAQSRAPANGGVTALEAEIAEYEKKYGLDSDRLLQELASGEREETEEILSWLMLLRIKDRVGSGRTS